MCNQKNYHIIEYEYKIIQYENIIKHEYIIKYDVNVGK